VCCQQTGFLEEASKKGETNETTIAVMRDDVGRDRGPGPAGRFHEPVQFAEQINNSNR